MGRTGDRHEAIMAKRKKRGGMGRSEHCRLRVRLRDGDNCYRCGDPMNFVQNFGRQHGKGPRPPNDATLEHIKPRANGGSYRLENLALSHYRCNLLAGARTGEIRFRVEHPNDPRRRKFMLTAWPAIADDEWPW